MPSIESRGSHLFIEKGETPVEDIGPYVDEGVEQALSLVRERFERSPETKDNLPFHNVEHTQGVIRRTELVLAAIREAEPSLVSERDMALGRLAPAYHDTVQKWEEIRTVEGPFTKVMRRRFVRENERASADEGVGYMEEVNSRDVLVFSESDKAVFGEAIDATIPDWDPLNKTVFQPQLTEGSSLIARAVALADLGTAGMDGPQAYTREGRAIFREDNLDVLAALQGRDRQAITGPQKEYFRSRMLAWLKFQPTFAKGRQARLEAELSAIPERARPAVSALFNKFDESIAAAEEVAKQAEAMNFEDLAALMGY